MNRFRELERFPKILLIALLLMTVAFGAVYGITASRVGYLHNDEIFVPRQSECALVYEGKVDGLDSSIVVALDTVIVNWGSKTYGPYTVREDPTAVPDGHPQMTGIEILDGNKSYFRGGVTDEATDFWLIGADGEQLFTMTYTLSDGTEMDMNGNPVDHMKPTPRQIISLLRGPELTHKGQWLSYIMGVFLAIVVAVSILFADELFYLSICFRVENAETAEPSDWHIATRSLGWLFLTIMTGVCFLMGLQ